MKKKNNIIIIIILIIIALITTLSYATYSWFKWRSNSNDAITVSLSGDSSVTFTAGPNITGSLSPVANYSDGIMKEVILTSNSSGNTFDLYLTINSIDSELRSPAFKWAIYSGGTYLDGGNFSNTFSGDDIILLQNRAISNGTEDVYNIYFWIDGNVENSSNMINKSIDMTLHVNKGIGNISYMMAKKSNSSATSPFWGSNINVNQVKSITFTNISEKPADAVTTDISADTGSGNVVMWYVPNGTTDDETPINLYDVYVASKDTNGVIYANQNASFLFGFLSNCESISFGNFNTSYVTNMYAMFDKCLKLTSLDLSNFNTSSVTNMSFMFNYCSSLTSLDLSSWNMSNVTNTNAMFQYNNVSSNIVMPNNYKRIDNYMFNHISYRDSTFTIPASVSSVGYTHIFYDFGNSYFKTFIVDPGNTAVKAVDGILYTYDGTRLLSIPGAKTFTDNTYTIPEGVTELNELSFARNKNINTLVLPNSYTIERDATIYASSKGYVNAGNTITIAIYRYTGINTYEVKSDNPNYISYDGCIYSKDGTELIAVPLKYSGALNIKAGTTTIGLNAFHKDYASEYTALTGINIPSSVTTIESSQITAINSIVTTNNIGLTVDAGNTRYQSSNNQLTTR